MVYGCLAHSHYYRTSLAARAFWSERQLLDAAGADHGCDIAMARPGMKNFCHRPRHQSRATSVLRVCVRRVKRKSNWFCRRWAHSCIISLTVNSSSSSLMTPGSASPGSCLEGLIWCSSLSSSSSLSNLLLLFPLTRLPIDFANFFNPLRFSKLPMLSKLPPIDCAAVDNCPNELLCLSFLVRSVRLPAFTIKPILTSSSPLSLVFSLPGLLPRVYLQTTINSVNNLIPQSFPYRRLLRFNDIASHQGREKKVSKIITICFEASHKRRSSRVVRLRFRGTRRRPGSCDEARWAQPPQCFLAGVFEARIPHAIPRLAVPSPVPMSDISPYRERSSRNSRWSLLERYKTWVGFIRVNRTKPPRKFIANTSHVQHVIYASSSHDWRRFTHCMSLMAELYN